MSGFLKIFVLSQSVQTVGRQLSSVRYLAIAVHPARVWNSCASRCFSLILSDELGSAQRTMLTE